MRSLRDDARLSQRFENFKFWQRRIFAPWMPGNRLAAMRPTAIFNHVFTIPLPKTREPPLVRLQLRDHLSLRLRKTTTMSRNFQGVKKMPTMSIARDGLASNEASVLNQITMFSVTGLAISLALVVVCGVGVIIPWL
jgi:hypothetical protein